MNADDFAALLEQLDACTTARSWARGRTSDETWASCPRGDWLLWLAERMDAPEAPVRRAVVLAVCDCVELALPIFARRRPNDERPRDAVATARRVALGDATPDDARAAEAAAEAAAFDAYAGADSDRSFYFAETASDAAAAAALVARSAYARYAADAALLAARCFYPRHVEAHRNCADIVRQHIPRCPTGALP